MSDEQQKDFKSVESRRNPRSDRRMTPLRRLYYFLGMPILRTFSRILTSTYRVQEVFGEEANNRVQGLLIQHQAEIGHPFGEEFREPHHGAGQHEHAQQ